MKFQVLKVKNALSQSEAYNLIEYHLQNKHLRSVGDGSDYRALNKIHIKLQSVRDTLNRLEQTAIGEIKKHSDQTVFTEMCNITEWPIGGVQEPHTDLYSNHEMRHEIESDGSRAWTAIVYLNTNYRGGRTYFPSSEHNPVTYYHTPEPQEMILFEGIHLLHGVEPVRGNSRHTVAIWFTTNKHKILTDLITDDLSLDHISIRNQF